MNIFIDTTKLERIRKVLVVLDIIIIILVLISYIGSGFKLGGLLGYISSQDIGGDDERPYAFIFSLFVGLLLTIVISLQLLVVHTIIKMVNNAYQYPKQDLKEKQEK